MYSKALETAAVLGEGAGSRTARPLYKMVTDRADWHSEYITQNCKWQNITCTNTNVTQLLLWENCFVIHCYRTGNTWPYLAHSYSTTSVVQWKCLLSQQTFSLSKLYNKNALQLTLQHSIMLCRNKGIVQSLTACSKDWTGWCHEQNSTLQTHSNNAVHNTISQEWNLAYYFYIFWTPKIS